MTKIIVKRSIYFILLCNIIVSCNEDPIVPKRPTYLQIDFPNYTFHLQKGSGPYEFKMPDTWVLKDPVLEFDGTYCQEEIDLSIGREINGITALLYRKFDDKDTLLQLITDSNKKVDYEKIKANTIHYNQIIDEENRIYGTFFELIGDGVATPFQFYLTDSLNNYMHGSVYMSYSKYEAAKPLLNHIKSGILELINTIKWAKD